MTNPNTIPNTRSHNDLDKMTPLEMYFSALFILIALMMITKWQVDRHEAIYAVLDQMNSDSAIDRTQHHNGE